MNQDTIQRIREAAQRVAETTEKGCLSHISTSQLPCDRRRRETTYQPKNTLGHYESPEQMREVLRLRTRSER